jgi:hypothetical protein
MDCPENRYRLASAFRRLRPSVVIGAAGRTPAASPDHYQGQLLMRRTFLVAANEMGRPL